MWLGEGRGNFFDWLTQRWVRATGRRVDPASHQWLSGPSGSTHGVGPDFFDKWAAVEGHSVSRYQSDRGLLPSFASLSGLEFNASAIDPAVAKFYEDTANYDMDVWSEWSPLFRPFAYLVSALFSRRLGQLNMPLSSLDTSLGITSEIVQVRRSSSEIVANAWLRTLTKTGRVLYVGSYSIATPPGAKGPCVKTVFPLPNGNAIVFLQPTVQADGSLMLVSEGQKFGDPGFYFTVHRPNGSVVARYLKRFRERIHVYSAEQGVVRTDHTMSLWGLRCLKLHYRLVRTAGTEPHAQNESSRK